MPERRHVLGVDEREHERQTDGKPDEDVGGAASHRGEAFDFLGELLPQANRVRDHVEEAGEATADLPLDGDRA